MSDQKIILFVGPDMCGKTEIARALSKELDIPYFKAESEHDTYMGAKDRFILQLQYADPRMVDFLKQTGHSAIFDRAYPCEFCYAKVFGRKTDHGALAYIDRKFSELGTRIIFCRRSSYQNIVDDLDSKITPVMLERLDRAYMDFCEWTKCSVLQLNVDDEDLRREIQDIKDWMKTYESTQR